MDPQAITLSQLKVFQFIPTLREENFKFLENLQQYKRNCFKDIHLITSLIIILGEVERRGFPFKDIKPSTIYTDGKICYIKEKDFPSIQQSNIVGNDSFKNFNTFVQQQFCYHKFQGVSSFDKALPKIYNVDELTTDQEMEILQAVYGITHDLIDQIRLGYFNRNKLNNQFKLQTKQMNEQKNSESIYKDINKLEKLNDIDSVCQMISYIRIGTTMNMFTEYFQQNLEQFLKQLDDLNTIFIEKLFEGLKDIHLKQQSHENLLPQQIFLIENKDSHQFKYYISQNTQDCSQISPPNFKGSNQDDMWQMGLILLTYLSQSQQKFDNHLHKKYNNDLLTKLDEIKNSQNNNLFIPLTFSLLQYNKDIRCNHEKLCQELRKIEQKQQFIQKSVPPALNSQSQLYDQLDYYQQVPEYTQQVEQPQLPDQDIKIIIKPNGQSNIKIKNPNIQNNSGNQNIIGAQTMIRPTNQINLIQNNKPQFPLLPPPNISDQKSIILKNNTTLLQGQHQLMKNNSQIIQKYQQIPQQQQEQISIQQNQVPAQLFSQNLFQTANGQQTRQVDRSTSNNQINVNNQRQGSNP
ncbi:hypothetical protein pb186bvf_016813 [Paramecium bursaria]